MKKSLFSEEYDAFCLLLRQTRESAGLSQNQLSKRLAVPQAWLSKCEHGQRRLDVVELWRICNALNIAPEEFIKQLDTILKKM